MRRIAGLNIFELDPPAGLTPQREYDAVAETYRRLAQPEHTKDSDCVVDPVTLCCRECHVLHGGEPCLCCAGVAFHVEDCVEVG